ncbi:MAG: hypothetical protein K8I82_16310 [Anaerolineae bacterium]|nr:hypothetical protein [Anaerolineae bacterium]
MFVQLLIFILMLAMGFPIVSQPINCTGLEESDCQILQNAAAAMKEAGSYNNAQFTGQMGGSGGTSTGNTGTVTGSGPVILDAEGLTAAADWTFNLDLNEGEQVPGRFILKDGYFYVASEDENGELVWTGTAFNTNEMIETLISGDMVAEALASPGVATTIRLEDTEMNGQVMQVYTSSIDFVTFLLSPSVLAALEEVIASMPAEEGGGMAAQAGGDIAGAVQLLPFLLSDDTIRYTVWVGAEDGLVHHLEFYMNIVLDATLIDPTIGEVTLNVDFKTDFDGVGQPYTVEAPTDYEPIEFDTNTLLEAGLSTSGGVIEDYTSEFTIAYGETVTGTLAGDNPWDVYSFEAAAGDVISIVLKAPILESVYDAQVILLNADGEEIAFNDDHDSDQENLGVLDSLISEFEIPADGEYRIVATWLAETRDGDYELTLEKAE